MPRATFENLPAAKRERLVRAAMAEFAAHPYREASLDRIAAAARVSKGSLYQYFEDKAELHRHVVLHELGARKLAAPPPAEGTFFERLEASFLAGLAQLRADPTLAALGARVITDESDPEVRALVRTSREQGVAYFRRELAAAVERGEIRADVDVEVAARLVAQVAGPALLEVLGAALGGDPAALVRSARLDERRLRETVRAVMDVLEHGLGARDARARAPRRSSKR